MQFDFKPIGDFIGQVGVPGGLLFMLGYIGVKLVPSTIRFLEGITTSLAKIEVTITNLSDDLRSCHGARPAAA